MCIRDRPNTIHVDNLKTTLATWQQAHRDLQQGSATMLVKELNTPTVLSLFEKIQPSFQSLQALAQTIINQPQVSIPVSTVKQVLKEENHFLETMDAIVFEYEQTARQKVNRLRRIELGLLGITLLVLLLELFFIFRPASNRIRSIIKKLSQSEKRATDTALDNANLVKSREQSLKELQTLNYAIDQTALFASLTKDGRIIHISEKFKQLLGNNETAINRSFPELLTQQEGEQDYIADLLKIPRSSIWNGEVSYTESDGKKRWLDMSIIPINQDGIQQDLLLLCNDRTLRKEAEQNITKLNQQQLESSIVQERLRSVQVVEAQEEERKRIAKDMHDGIGQMLTALKFNLESVNLKNPEKAANKLTKVKELAGDVIKGVRVATFNLMPPELSDYGITKGLAKLAEGLSQLTGKNILFENPSNFTERFDSNIETNLYRITQEAVNNAIKYANSNYILITLSHSNDLLSIVVDDDGIGFNPDHKKVELAEDGSGMGLAFMQERIKYINGRLFLSSREGHGTRVTINMPIADSPITSH